MGRNTEREAGKEEDKRGLGHNELEIRHDVPAHGVAHRTDRTAVRRSGSEPDLFLENADPKLI